VRAGRNASWGKIGNPPAFFRGTSGFWSSAGKKNGARPERTLLVRVRARNSTLLTAAVSAKKLCFADRWLTLAQEGKGKFQIPNWRMLIVAGAVQYGHRRNHPQRKRGRSDIGFPRSLVFRTPGGPRQHSSSSADLHRGKTWAASPPNLRQSRPHRFSWPRWVVCSRAPSQASPSRTRIFTRIGGPGRQFSRAAPSTFLVEMSDVAAILNHASRGGASFLSKRRSAAAPHGHLHGLSIAWAVVEASAKSTPAAAARSSPTHYHAN